MSLSGDILKSVGAVPLAKEGEVPLVPERVEKVPAPKPAEEVPQSLGEGFMGMLL